MKKLILFPFNGNTKEACSTVDAINAKNPTWDLLGFIDDDLQKKGLSFGEYEVLGNRAILSSIGSEVFVLAAPGRPENYRQRSQIISSLQLDSERFATIVHPSASIGLECTIGRNCLLMANVVLTANVSIYDHIVILPNTVISHDTTIREWTLIGSNVSISGGVNISENCYIGTGSKIINDLQVGAGSMIGIGSVVIHHIPNKSIVAGNPARKIHEA